MNCNCNQPAKLLVVKKEGPNQGREFYACANERGNQCQFFEWANGNPSNPKPVITPGIQLILDRLELLETNILEKCAPR